MSLLVQDNLASALCIVLLADDNASQPAEGCHMLGMTIDADSVGIVLRPDAAPADDASHGKYLTQTDAQNGHCSDGIQDAYDVEPRKGLFCPFSLREGWGVAWHLDRHSHLQQTFLQSLNSRHVVHRDIREVAQGQHQAQQQDGQQGKAVETEHLLPENQEYTRHKQQCEQYGRLDSVD